MKDIPFIIPSPAEQTAIADFLDRKTAQIDKAIAQKEALIERLKERRQILIHRAVTRGLDPDVKMKDCGVEWIGEVPAGWEVRPLTKFATTVDYRGKTPMKVDEGVFLITTKNIKGGEIDYALSKEYVTEKEYPIIMSRGLPKVGDLLFTMEAPLGMSAVVDNELVAIGQRIIKFRFNKQVFNQYFVNYSIQSAYFQNHLQREGTGSTALGIKASKLHKLRIICPPISEQEKVVVHIDAIRKSTDQAVAMATGSIGKIREYKSTLINAAVTGKIKVVE